MLVFLSKVYFGAWQNLFCLNWPLRFLIEYIVFGIIPLLLLIGICILLKKTKLKKFLVTVWCVAVREIVYLLGHEKNWAVEIDNKMIDWALQKISGAGRRRKPLILKIILIPTVILVYFLAVFVDMPVARYISDECLWDMQNIKAFFQRIETSLSRGYEQYAPLFVSAMKDEEVTVEDILPMPEEKEPIYIRLNNKGKDGSNIRSEVDLSNNRNIIGVVNENSEIQYRDEWHYDGKRYWLRVYVPAKEIEGWLSGQLVDSEQLQEIVENEEK